MAYVHFDSHYAPCAFLIVRDGGDVIVSFGERAINLGTANHKGTMDLARLIAAAPDLLEALKACLAHGLDEGEPIGHDYHGVGAPSSTEKRAGKIEEQARAVIAKATGKD